jgi:hypothetical protein
MTMILKNVEYIYIYFPLVFHMIFTRPMLNLKKKPIKKDKSIPKIYIFCKILLVEN